MYAVCYADQVNAQRQEGLGATPGSWQKGTALGYQTSEQNIDLPMPIYILRPKKMPKQVAVKYRFNIESRNM